MTNIVQPIAIKPSLISSAATPDVPPPPALTFSEPAPVSTTTITPTTGLFTKPLDQTVEIEKKTPSPTLGGGLFEVKEVAEE